MTLTRSNKPTGCPFCSGRIRWNNETFRQHVEKETAGSYRVLGKYVKSKSPIEIKHDECNSTFLTTPDRFLRGSRCPSCFGTPKKTTESFKAEILIAKGPDYEVISEYLGTNQKVRMRHCCGHEWSATPNNLLNNGSGCPKCCNEHLCHTRSKYVATVLEEMKISFRQEVSFKGCRYKRKLRFDYYLPEHNLLIEFDGVQHFYPTFDEKSFKEGRKRDAYKNRWAAENFISLLRVNHTHGVSLEKMRRILNGFFSEKRSTTIERHRLYFINEDSTEIFDNGKYDT